MSATPHTKLHEQHQQLLANSPSVLRYTPMLWSLKWLLRLLSLLFLGALVGSFFDNAWLYAHNTILGVENPAVPDTMITMKWAIRAGLLLALLLSMLATWLTRLALRRNWYILELEGLATDSLKALKEAEQKLNKNEE